MAATALVVAAGLSLLSSASDTANATSTGPASARTHIYRLGIGYYGFVERCCPRRWNAYNEGSELVGKIRRSRHGRWNVYLGYSRVGYAEPSSGGRWNVYSYGRRAGHVKRSYGNRWNVFDSADYRAGYAQGPGGAVAGAALLLLMPPK